MDEYQTISDMFTSVCKQYSHSDAFNCLGQTITFGELDKLSRNFAAYLQYHTTLAPGDRMAIQLPNILQYPVVLFGALRAGVVIVNTNPQYTGRELEHQLRDSGAKVLVVLANVAKPVEEIIDKTDVQHVIVTEVGDLHRFPKRQLINGVLRHVKKQVPKYHFSSSIKLLRALQLGRRDTFTDVTRRPDDLAFLQYTGGTTGVAKGAMLSQSNIMGNTRQVLKIWDQHLEKGSEVWLAPLPLYHIYGFIMHCMVLFAVGGKTVLIPDPRELSSVIKAFKQGDLTGLIGLNTLFIAWMRNAEFQKINFSKLKYTISGGMSLNESTANRWMEVTGKLPIEGYGLTETSPVVTSNDPVNPLVNTIGCAIPETELKVVDGLGNSVRNEPGELCVRGPQVMQGYWKRPEATSEVLDSDGWLRTGDIATMSEEGYVRIVDRQKDMIVVSGFNVYPNEVESILVSHPEIVEAAVIGVKNDESGETVKAFIVRAEDSQIKDSAIKDFCRQSLTAYKVPRLYEFRDELPKTNVGKVLRRQLRE